MSQPQEQAGGVARILLLALGFACLLLSQSLPFVADGSLGRILSGPESPSHAIAALACLMTLAALALLSWAKAPRPGKAVLVLAGAVLACSNLGFALTDNELAHLIGGAFAGISAAVLMHAWAQLLASLTRRQVVQSTLAGFVAGAVVLLASLFVPVSAVFAIAALASLACACLLLAIDPSLSFSVSDGPLSREQVSSIPWFAVVVVVACGLLGAFLLGVGVQVTWVYGLSLNYLALAIALVSVVLLTALIMVGEGEWLAAVWVPLFVIFLVADVFACLSTSLAVAVSLGLLLGCVASLQFLRFSLFPALVGQLQLPRAFSTALLLALSGGYLSAGAGAFAGRSIALGMKGLSQMAGIVAVVVLVLFAVMVALFMRRPRQAAVMASSSADMPPESDANPIAARIASLASEFGLTEREVEVAELSSQGFNAPYIAERLVVSQSTVRFHLQNVYRKLGIHSRAELIELVNEPAE